MVDELTERRELAQSRPSTTSTTQVYQPTGLAFISSIIVANVTGSAAAYSIYLDKDGTTYNQGTALFYSVMLPANCTDMIEFDVPVPITSQGNLAVQSGTSSSLTFTVYGAEKV